MQFGVSSFLVFGTWHLAGQYSRAGVLVGCIQSKNASTHVSPFVQCLEVYISAVHRHNRSVILLLWTLVSLVRYHIHLVR